MRLIDADKLHYVKMLVQNPNNGKHKHLVAVRATEINKAPAVDVQPVIHAKWEHISYYSGGYGINETCSNCGCTIHGQIFDLVDKYCPHCGAKMDLKED